MNTTQLIAFVGLGFFWLHTLLMATHAWREGRRLRTRLRVWQRGLRAGRVIEGEGDDQIFARHRVEQVGRSNGDGRVHFHDRAYVSELCGGVVEFDDGRRSAVDGGRGVEVWTDPSRRTPNTLEATGEAAASALVGATKARGLPRTLEVELRPGDRVWVYGLDDAQAHPPIDVGGVEVPDPGVAMVADFDPRPWAARHARRAQLAAVGFVLLTAACSVPMLWPPRFGWLGVVGALSAVVVFNLLQLFLNLVREDVREPPRRAVRGVWAPGRST